MLTAKMRIFIDMSISTTKQNHSVLQFSLHDWFLIDSKFIADHGKLDSKLRKCPISMNSMVYDTMYLNKLLTNPQLRFEISRMQYPQIHLESFLLYSFHVDKREYNYVDVKDKMNMHEEEYCYVFEKNLADLFIASDNTVLIKVNREEEFAPVIYKTKGEYSMEQASRYLMSLHQKVSKQTVKQIYVISPQQIQ